ncbi:MAG: EAL domain-containing protein [Ahrensia sp.]|nr:EAL domain-containing protein [Ahrensia sp.]
MRSLVRHFFGVLLLLAAASTAHALEPVEVNQNLAAIDLSNAYETFEGTDRGVSVQTAPDANGVVSRIEVRSSDSTAEAPGGWIAFALANNSDVQIDRLIVAPHYRLVGSGFVWPDLGSSRIRSITPSEGFQLDRQAVDDADVFRITLDPGSVITFVAEMSSKDVPQLTLWEPDAYKDTINSFTLYEGIVLGIAGLLAVFLTILFVVKGSIMFPAAAALAWSALVYVCVDFGFIGKMVSLQPGELNLWRAGSEILVSASVVLFLYAYLHLSRWNTRYTYLMIAWLVALASLAALALFNSDIAAGLARFSFALTAILGLLLVIVLSLRKFDRAILLIPTWMLLCAWLMGAFGTVNGALDNDIIQPALGGGLVLIVLLISFTVMQHAFAGGTLVQGLVSDVERQALALAGCGDTVWDWDVDRDEIFTGPEASDYLGLPKNALNGSPTKWLELLHPEDRDRFKTMLDVVIDHRRGRIMQDFRLRSASGHYHWMNLRARPVIGNDGEVLRCVGTLSDVTEQRVASQRLLHDAVHDNLTGLPNRELFMDRLETAIAHGRANGKLRPSLFFIDLDRFSQINEGISLSVGDSVLLTMARRLGRLLKPQDSLARLSGDQFALLLNSQSDPDRIAIFADAIRQTVKKPISYADKEIFVTASIGLVSWSAEQTSAEDMVRDAELAMFQAQRVGGDRIEPFRPTFRSQQTPAIQVESELQRALDRDEIEVHYQPIINLEHKTVAGFEALLRWRHPRRGLIMPADFIPLAEKNGLIVPLGLFALRRAAQDLSHWQKSLDGTPVFVSVNISSRQLLRHDLITDVKGVLDEVDLLPNTLKLELTESLVMENPEQSSTVLRRIKALGAGLSLDDFGTGYSSLSQLMRFPFDTIKIDRIFVSSDHGRGRPIILRSIVGMAHDLGMAVVAEGAEDENDAFELHQLGCEFAQGFLFGEPMNADLALKAMQQDLRLSA